MIKIQKISKALILLLAVAGLFSCSDDDNVSPFEVTGDVFISSREPDGERLYAASYYAYGTQPMGIAKVDAPNNAEEIVLSPTDDYENTWFDIPELSDFTNVRPIEGNYLFRVTHEDVPHETSDLLNHIGLGLSEITTLEMASGTLSVIWSADTETYGHSITLLNATREVVFASAFVLAPASQLEIGVNAGTGNWASGYPNEGDVYTLELNAIALESNAPQENPGLHIEEIAISVDTVAWE